ncbi:alpha/beta hydrolase [Cellvibrio japonicus]|uniref:Hydrolase, alpha/beta fold family n=1 Tax=Cellvibrio japonicus (strain Ueda107) TaxID=498211 RepID=B3PGH5_CELJU|nr:alpha/beta hydrolase [Cellvibrio japonicus]ACE82899.1 hydrolase, alpha/beta fold family [Cellvibrio japonicus Ueda107]QEI10962.1 alpha/beta hydrolase [Cellvibrio japonicus]QEI14538.1 alpha/beta hydrolase [Cellvibrio japonicus]QEI18116.1 alpha/beta hydrolase [Cellvibrio japonicus]
MFSSAPVTDNPAWLSLLGDLPPLRVEVTADNLNTQDARVQAYLAYYGIHFARNPGLVHGFGGLEIAGYRIATHYWLPAGAKGTLVVVHGYYDHAGIFGHAIRFGLEQQLAVVAFDLPGHGLSSGDRVAIDRFDTYADILAGVLERLQPVLPQPLYALGQSTGGAVLLNHLWRYPRQAAHWHRIALAAPLLLPRGWILGRISYALLRPFCRRLRRSRSRSSHDETFLEFLDQRDPLQDKTLSVQWVGAMKDWNAQFRAFPAKETPLLVVQGTADGTVAWRYNLRQIRRKLPHARVALIEGAGHQLVNERDDYRQQAFMQIHRFFFDN